MHWELRCEHLWYRAFYMFSAGEAFGRCLDQALHALCRPSTDRYCWIFSMCSRSTLQCMSPCTCALSQLSIPHSLPGLSRLSASSRWGRGLLSCWSTF